MNNKEIAEGIQELCEDIKKEIYDNDYCALDPKGVGNILDWVRMIKSMSHYIKE